MRLINVHTLEFEDFFEAGLPKYAILSHRWTGREITYQDFVEGGKNDSAGYRKVVELCNFIRRHSIASAWDNPEPVEWVWIDTCCIDKKSSAELSKAINSMYSWYSQARVCIVYLYDLQTNGEAQLRQDLSTCSWFWRGWTLPELIALSVLLFCYASWSVRGFLKRANNLRSDTAVEAVASFQPIDLLDDISSITGIPRAVLTGEKSLWQYSVAQKMSWASKRTTTRTEDTAYCLLGIFDVNMPLIYGEGKRAFRRLQEDIIKRTPDQSILAWSDADVERSAFSPQTTLAQSPKCFAESADIEWDRRAGSSPFAVTNLGLEMNYDLLVPNWFG
ncbi:hypothetical protein M409DRAFT_35887 [Zasmidium cellare ATCC 36951]|uniref:Uncharacterized protein n=1 Tax=Zasmidium cellare ATCC 36951 TaxID=1080233 RepID=A0A6A6CV47_ZASCE|nr:uncharacterized protein M409DRAFT_35887 [Zasmidium cellare ATCC 36951]KAF2171047.1 hypothetical protein M409DRAFT_35887 [Zasmidium cellare ATCC 36951]